MSSGERKKRGLPQGAKGWEEAGGEFFQESYPGAESDLEVMQNDPHRICTLLPSKKNRCGTLKKDTKLTTFRHRATIKSRYQTAVVPNNEIQISLLPDLSENLSNEKLLWEEIMKIKAMPVNMTQKKELKAKLLSKDTLRLQGFKQFKWKKKQSMMQLNTQFKELNEKLTLWRCSLKKIEGFYGTGVVSFFLFLKWLIFLNIILTVMMSVFVVLPSLYFKSYNATSPAHDNATNVSPSSAALDRLSSVLFDLIFDSESMNSSPLYYSYYSTNFYIDLYYLRVDQQFAYILATLLCLAYSFVSVLKSAACGFKHRLLESQGQFYIYCNIVFSGWDYCIQNEKSAHIKHKALYNEVLARLAIERRKEEQLNRTKQEWLKLCFVRVVINVTVLILLSIAGYIIFTAFQHSTKTISTDEWYMKVLVEFQPAGLIVFFNLVLPYFFHWLTKYEHFSPIFSIQLTIFRTVMLRFSSLCILLGSVYDKSQKKPTEANVEQECWEAYLARELYKLLILSVLTQIAYTFLVNLPRSLIVRHCNNRFTRYIGKPEFYLPSHVLDVVYIQTIIWLGCFYAPLLPAFGVVIVLIVFYIKKFTCLVNCRPAFDIYCASRSHSLYMFILLISYAFSVIPWAYSVVEMKPSEKYGPFTGYETVWQAVVNMCDKLPLWMSKTAEFCTSSAVVVPLFVVLALTTYYYYAVYVVNKRMVLELKQQLVLEGHDKQFLLNRLSAFIKQQQERHRRPVHVD